MIPDPIPLNVRVSFPVHMIGFLSELNTGPTKVDHSAAYIDFLLEHYCSIYKGSKTAKKWLSIRKIILSSDEENFYKVGLSDRSLGRQFVRSDGRRSEVKRGLYQQLGILKPSGFPFFDGHIVFPFYDIDGHVVGIYGRRITQENRKGHIYYHYWINGKSSFFNWQALRKYKRVILTKSPIEALTLISAGIPNVIALMGIQGFDEQHLMLLEKFRPQEIVIGFDNSDQGNILSGLIAQSIESIDIQCFRLALPSNSDINDYARSQIDHAQALKDIVDCAFPFHQSYELLSIRR